ncbi:MAG TPA: M1 family metallopeptidase [Vicinamibacteria bacterium]|nr:M1 family metallopeptidase [Vicinamibacteria bacterium]
MRTAAALTVLTAGLLASVPPPTADTPAAAPSILPPLPEAGGRPEVPAQSPRNASYTMKARLDPGAHTIEGTLVLEWRNVADVPLQTFPFHLYWNAFRNNLSTSARGEGRRAARARAGERGFGYVQVRSVRLARGEGAETDLTTTMRYVSPDDGNPDDRTVMEVTAPAPVPSGGTARFAIDWSARIPYGDVGRAGWVHDYHFIAQWFPKIGVYGKGGWNAHQFHPWTEFFADYGVYDVSLTLPRGFVVGATGTLRSRSENPDGSETLRFVEEDVHDFAWTASRRFREMTARFAEPGYPPVDIRLLVQPEREHLSERYLEATKIALRSYGTWSVPYPYGHVTVVDPAWSSASGGMEYPTLFTGGASVWAPPALQSPESVTIHEAGHQFWYGLVATNEFEEAWLDEGLNSYHEEKAAQLALGPVGWAKRYFGLTTPTRGRRGGWPVVAPGVWIGRGENDLSALREQGQTDVMARPAWHYLNPTSYTLNSYGKPALSFQTLEGLLGEEIMTRVLRTYARRHLYGHPTTADFIAVVNEVTGSDYGWFFDQTWFSSDLCDYAVSASNEPQRRPEGFVEAADGRLLLAERPREEETDPGRAVDGEVVVRRLGGVRLPVEVLVEFADGRTATASWDGKDRWTRLRYPGSRVTRALVDPAGKIALDVNPSNNSWVDEQGVARRAARKWTLRYLLWLQHLLELHTVAM